VVDKAGNVDGELEFQGHQNQNPALNGAGHISLSGFAVPTTVHLPFIPADPNGNYLLIFQCSSGRWSKVRSSASRCWPVECIYS
jgi:hypothetical protein